MNAPPFPHLPVETLVALSLSGEWDPHVEECAFCREQLEFLRSVERDLAATEGEVSAAPFRLAAASVPDFPAFTLRRTWYLSDREAMVRVFEDEKRQILVGSLLMDPRLYGQVRVRFSGIGHDFLPDEQGKFDIGPLELDVEPMTVTLTFPLH